MPILRLILFVAPFAIAWMLSPTGLPMSIARIGANEATPLDWGKLGLVVVLGIIFSRIPGKGK